MFIDQDCYVPFNSVIPPTSGIGIGIDRFLVMSAMTGQTTIQEVLLFPQMRPEKTVKKDNADKYVALGISEEWVPALQKAGYLTVEMLKDANANKLRQELCELNKKYKLRYPKSYSPRNRSLDSQCQIKA